MFNVISCTLVLLPAAGEDYNSTTVPLVFTGQDIFLINLTLIDNVEVDSENETFTVQLVLDDPPPNLQVGLTNITVIILDNGMLELMHV